MEKKKENKFLNFLKKNSGYAVILAADVITTALVIKDVKASDEKVKRIEGENSRLKGINETLAEENKALGKQNNVLTYQLGKLRAKIDSVNESK